MKSLNKTYLGSWYADLGVAIGYVPKYPVICLFLKISSKKKKRLGGM